MNKIVLGVALVKLGLPQIAIARQLGIDPGTLSRWKQGWVTVPDKYRDKLAQLLNVNKRDLFTEGEPHDCQ